jgi:hypothetical protein
MLCSGAHYCSADTACSAARCSDLHLCCSDSESFRRWHNLVTDDGVRAPAGEPHSYTSLGLLYCMHREQHCPISVTFHFPFCTYNSTWLVVDGCAVYTTRARASRASRCQDRKALSSSANFQQLSATMHLVIPYVSCCAWQVAMVVKAAVFAGAPLRYGLLSKHMQSEDRTLKARRAFWHGMRTTTHAVSQKPVRMLYLHTAHHAAAD